MKLLLAVLVVVFLVSGCGKNGHWYVEWPANLAEVSNFPDNQRASVLSAIDEVNGKSQRNLISMSNTETDSTVHIVWVPSIPNSSMSTRIRSARGATSVAGRATVEANRCTIEIVDLVARDNELLKPVLWHEIGHCAGLEHDPVKGEVMYKEATPLSQLTSSSVNRFFSQLAAAASL